MQKMPYMVVIGKRDIEAGVVSVRKRGEGDLGGMPLDELLGRMIAEREA
jgi:threonyl-tRNA synthetase